MKPTHTPINDAEILRIDLGAPPTTKSDPYHLQAEIRLPTTQYGYINFQVYGTPEKIIAEHNRIVELYNNPETRPDALLKEYNRILDRYLTENAVSAADWELLSDKQRDVFQTIKRSLKRIEAKTNNNN